MNTLIEYQQKNSKADHGPAPILKSFSAHDHRRRLLNIQAAEQSVRGCLKKHLITNYLSGQANYTIGEYPSFKPYDPDEYDERELEELANSGIQLIQIMEDWNDLLRIHGADKFTSQNPAGLRRFIEMAHGNGIKVLLYVSTGYMQHGDLDLEEGWTREPRIEVHSGHWELARCSPASAGWRSYILQKTVQVLDEYDIDGLYNDWGYIPLHNHKIPPTADEVLAFEETADHDAAKEDLMALVYSEVKRRGGIYKMHADFNNRPLTKEHLYDYLWVGEGVGDFEKMRAETKTHPNYVVPCFDCRFGKIENEDHQYLHTIPYMQFPQLMAGRHFTGESSMVEGVSYRTEETDGLLRQWRDIWRYSQANPDGPYIYSMWDQHPPRPNIRETYVKWLRQYQAMTEYGTYAYLEISDSSLFAHELPKGVVASLFVNQKTYLVLANYNKSRVTIETTNKYIPSMDGVPVPRTSWTFDGETLLILQKCL